MQRSPDQVQAGWGFTRQLKQHPATEEPHISRIASFLIRDDGTTAVEYSVPLALILMTVIAAVGTLGAESGGLWTGNQEAFAEYGFGG